MKIYDETKTKELTDYDLNKGYLKSDKILIAHYEAVEEDKGEWHYEVVAEYPNGGKDLKMVYDRQPTMKKEAYDEYEDIGVYVKYTDEELNAIEIENLKRKLLETDYIIAKMYESGLKSNSQMEELKKEYAEKLVLRAQWRERINLLEGQIGMNKK